MSSVRRTPGPGHCALALLAAFIGASSCGRPPAPRAAERPDRRANSAQPVSRPAVRVGRFLRLPRAGRVSLVRRPGGGLALICRVEPKHRDRVWQRAVDTQGNLFRVSPEGRIVPDGEPRPGRQPASVENVAYYAAQAIALLAQPRYRRQGLVLAAEVLDLPPRDASVRAAQRWFCHLFARLGIVGPVRRRLYQRLIAVSHRAGPLRVVRNHVFSFSVRLPLDWSVLAGPAPAPSAQRRSPAPRRPAKSAAPGRSPRPARPTPPVTTTAVVAAIPGAGAAPAGNLLWISTRLPATASVQGWMRSRLSALSASRGGPHRRLVSLPPLPGLHGRRAVAIGPLHMGRRTFSTLHFGFRDNTGVAHLVSLYVPAHTVGPRDADRLHRVLRTFRIERRPHPCEPASSL